VNHLYAKGGDGPLFGRYQPTPTPSDNRRIPQAQVLHDFIAQAVALTPAAKVVTLGDFNDFDFTPSMSTLTGRASGNEILTDLGTALLPAEERYSYVFEGNSQELDHIYVTPSLMAGAQFQPIHVNAEYSDQVSDHDPMIASLLLPVPDTTPPSTSALASPAPNAAGWNAGPVTVTLTSSDNTGGSGVASIQYATTGAQVGSGSSTSSPATVGIAAEGTTTLTYYATDRAGNVETSHALTIRIDMTAPVLTVPTSIAVDATSASGATVTYVVAATDNSALDPTIACTPASGTTFAIGTATVSCTATDAAGNASAATFAVAVRSVAEQVARLAVKLQGFEPNAMPAGLANAVQNTWAAAQRNRNDTAFCQALANVASQAVKAGAQGDLDADAAAALAADANRIRAVEGCR